jgi:hypothetical protein
MSRILIRRRPIVNVSAITWTPITPTSGWPAYNGYLELRYDSVNGRMLHYGMIGGASGIYSTNLFSYANRSTHIFTNLGGNNSLSNDCTDTSPDWPGNRHPVGQWAFDADRHGVWLSCGVCSGTNWTDLWFFSLDTNTWTKLTPAHYPTPRNSASIVRVTNSDVLFLFGTDGGAQTHDHWVYGPTDLNPTPGTLTAAQIAAGCTAADDWCEVSVTGGVQPTGVQFPKTIFNATRDDVWMFGGMSSGGTPQNETWVYKPTTQTWTQKALSTTAPPVYTGPGSPAMFCVELLTAFGASGQYVYRQTYNTGSPRDWCYDPVADTWTVITSLGTGPALDAVCTVDQATKTMIAFSRNASGDPDVWHGVVS